MIPTLYHFTCSHGHQGISRTGLLLPNAQAFMPALGPVLWLTDLAAPSADSVGLSSTFLSCDRRAYRYVVRTRAAVAWATVRVRVPSDIRGLLERFGEPDHWWVARRPLLPSEFQWDDTWRGGREDGLKT